MNIFLSGLLSTFLGGLKMFLPTIVADAGIPAEDQAAVVTLADNLIAFVQKPEPIEQEFVDDCDSLVTILQNAKKTANPDISKALAAIIGALEGLKAEYRPAQGA